MTDSHANAANRPEPEIEPYAYPEMPWSSDLHTWSNAFGRETMKTIDPKAVAQPRAANGHDNGHAAAQPPEQRFEAQQRAEIDAQWMARLGEETRQAAEKGRREGFALGLERGREEAAGASRDAQERLLGQSATLASSFAEERSRYFHQAEGELVRLALAIAARILRREAQMDPLLLTGAVRVALGQLAQTTAVRVHVPEADRLLWEEVFARLPNLAHRPEVVGEAEMELGECRLETELGSADVSLWEQLKEIERGFFDRVGARGVTGDVETQEAPATRSAPRTATNTSPRRGSAQPSEVASAGSAGAAVPAASAVTTPVDENMLTSAMYNEREW